MSFNAVVYKLFTFSLSLLKLFLALVYSDLNMEKSSMIIKSFTSPSLDLVDV